MNAPLEFERANTILYCGAWAETVGFYRDTFGLEPGFANDWFVEFAIADGSYLSIADGARATIASGAGAGITLSWRVADLDHAHRTLADRGAEPGVIHQRWGAAAFHVHDPEGHRIELWMQG